MFYFLLFAVAQARVFRGASKSKRVFRFSAAMAHLVSGGIGEEHFHERLLLLPKVSLEAKSVSPSELPRASSKLSRETIVTQTGRVLLHP